MKAMFVLSLLVSANAFAVEDVKLHFSDERGLTSSETCILELVKPAIGAHSEDVYNSPFMMTSSDKTKAYHAVYVGNVNEVTVYTLVFHSTSTDGWSAAHIVKPVYTKSMSGFIEILRGDELIKHVNVEACFKD